MGIRYYNNSGINMYKVNALSFTFISYLDHVSDSRMRFHQSPQQLHGYILKMHGFVGHTIKKASAGGMRCPYVPVCIVIVRRFYAPIAPAPFFTCTGGKRIRSDGHSRSFKLRNRLGYVYNFKIYTICCKNIFIWNFIV